VEEYPIIDKIKKIVKNLFCIKNREYNLPAKFQYRTAIIITIIFSILPDFPKLPLGQIFAAGVIVYFLFRSNGENELGLSVKISRGAKKASAIIIAITIVLNVVILIGAEYEKPDYTTIPEIGPHQFEQSPYADSHGWGPDERIYQALTDKDMMLVLRYLVKRLLISVVMAPISESAIYFAMLFPVIWRRYSYRRALWVVPLIFMLMHFRPSDFDVIDYPSSFISGVLFALPYAKTRSLYPSIILHVCWNTSCYAMLTIFNWGLPPPLK
jgi:hypothetical protein